MKKLLVFICLLTSALLVVTCSEDPEVTDKPYISNQDGPSPYYLKVPTGFPDYFLDKENQLTEEGIALGKKLFFDPILSRNQNVSCSSCHLQENAFSDPRTKSEGTHGEETKFHSMPLFNMAWMNEFFWNGRAKSREAQALQPVINPVEMDLSWDEAVERLRKHPEYPDLFEAAFESDEIDSMLVAKAIVQYEMTLVSANSKFDRWMRGEVEFTESEANGQAIFDSEIGDCFHCHGRTMLTTDNSFHNNGLDADADLQPGLAAVTGKDEDFGKFKTPTLRNLAFTAPYMHDGRFETLEEVIDFYSEEVHDNRNVDALMKFAPQGGIQLNKRDKKDLLAFLLTMTDSSFVNNASHGQP